MQKFDPVATEIIGLKRTQISKTSAITVLDEAALLFPEGEDLTFYLDEDAFFLNTMPDTRPDVGFLSTTIGKTRRELIPSEARLGSQS